MSNYKLYYFNGRGRAEVTRLIFAQAGQKFEDIRWEHSEWPQHKAETPLGQMPVLEVDGTKLPQSLSIARFVAKKFNLAGRDNLEQAKVDSVIDTNADLLQKFVTVSFEKDEQKKQQALETFQQEDLPKQLQNLETLLTNYGQTGPYFLGANLTWADLMFLDMVEKVQDLVKTQNFLDKYPKLKRNHDEVQKQPKIAAYLKSRPQTPF
ncbi:unnamed protein product [Didymodactylos carnosus]|uniref:glutathione transferase n=1 Tax=Didymodactylos carnosus TaxID=1234261 RepID=A0A815IFD9_9BILA|nr:unnamed protein product [Didymodactylos carnosus]CAF1365224.1 unnamed protein product [Didymodactylos carnosus]CAF4135767.1 unnamed protein product [Didymodactylos carnosus]CAF4247023.1 unnamed protein product [Didymodactylos carnosus]